MTVARDEIDAIDLPGRLDFYRSEVTRRLNKDLRSTLGQFITPSSIGHFMASMVSGIRDGVILLDPGAGIGTLFASVVDFLCKSSNKPRFINVTAYEVDPVFYDYLNDVSTMCQRLCSISEIKFDFRLIPEDFIASTSTILHDENTLFNSEFTRYTHAILNPPYHKIHIDSNARKMLRNCGIETSNLYTAFLWLSSLVLSDDGQMISITPRSFCNGLYFKPFRKHLLNYMNIERLHLFQSRTEAFCEDDVLQENVIMSARRGSGFRPDIIVSSSHGIDDESINVKELNPSDVFDSNDPEIYIHIATDDLESRIVKLGTKFKSTLDDLGLEVSTGKVVDFRSKQFIQESPISDTVPLIYPAHFDNGYVSWPIEEFRKSNRILISPDTADLLVNSENYVLVKRFSSKEEKKRVVAAIYDSSRIAASKVGFENHVNYFHSGVRGLDITIAKGLSAYLNSSFVDTYFRNFSGHTQVNATDLRNLKYPSMNELRLLGQKIGEIYPAQEELDRIVEEGLLMMSNTDADQNPFSAKNKIAEALSILPMLGFPRAQLNERSALTLLALLDLRPSSNWSEANSPLCGITPMMDFFSKHYGKNYKPNTRETVRRQTVHQFLEAGLIIENPDAYSRPINSPKVVYQMENGALELLRTFKTSEWDTNLKKYLSSRKTLVERYAKERQLEKIPVIVGEGKTIYLSPGGQNVLVEQIISEFAPRFTPGGDLVYIGDTDKKFAHYNHHLLEKLGVFVEPHGKMPDVIIYFRQKDWLFLIEAVTSHGPIDSKRHGELQRLFGVSTAGLVFVTAFLERKAMVEYLGVISWETEVWVAESPTHLIHFNGERFLGPY